MKNRLSHSAAKTFTECGEKYRLHYIEKLRPITQSSALLFGTAIDKALEASLKGEDPFAIFNKIWNFQSINGKETFLPTSELVIYFNSDLDIDLLLNSYSEEKFNYIIDLQMRKKEYGIDSITGNDFLTLQEAYWTSLFKKGELMISSFQNLVIPNIEKVLATQVPVSLQNENGDSIIGFADLMVKWKGYEKPICMDIKTASKPYLEDSVRTSDQLGLYIHSLSDQYENTKTAGYIVLNKKIKKVKLNKCLKCGETTETKHKKCNLVKDGERCNGEFTTTLRLECPVQIIIDEVSLELEDIIINKFDGINTSIQNGDFIMNLDSCESYYGLCPYYFLCHNNNMDGLVSMKKEKK